MIGILFQSPMLFLLVALVMVISVCVHEYSHAFVSNKLGDPTAKLLGRLTLNPRAHLDPVGAIFLLFFGFGWGKPVPFNPINLKNPKRDAALISFAGPLSNFVLALAVGLVFHLVGANINSLVGMFLSLVVEFNLLMGFFNLLPFHPLDGFKVVYGLLPMNLAIEWMQTERFGIFILLFMVITQSTGMILTPLLNFSLKLLGF